MADSWRDSILKDFTPQVARLTLVEDPDDLLTEEGVLQGIRERGFDLITFEDSIAFRFAYESKYRSHWDRRETTDLVVALRSPRTDVNSLPFDLLQTGRRLSFNLGVLFPKLTYSVIETLDHQHLDALYRAQHDFDFGPQGLNATIDFVLRHVFGIVPELIKQPPDLLRMLLSHHHRSRQMPPMLSERLIKVLRQSDQFATWPLEQIVVDRRDFFAFLQERWPIFVERLAMQAAAAGGRVIQESASDYALNYLGPRDLPFEHDDVRVLVDSLFLDGVLQPIAHEQAGQLAQGWVALGLKTNPLADPHLRFNNLVTILRDSIPAIDARHQLWLAFARRWATLRFARIELAQDLSVDERGSFQDLQQQVDQAFLTWVKSRYVSLYNQPPSPPVMVHHIPRAMARQFESTSQAKAALIVVDALALDQWLLVREVFEQQRPAWRLRDDAVFAWLPTITAVSRQATFAGKLPIYFPSSINTNDREPTQWTQFWSEHGHLSSAQIGYQRALGDLPDLMLVEEILSQPALRVIGLVVDKVDKIGHGMALGAAGMHNQIRQWLKEGFLVQLIDRLKSRGFTIYLTADHGNVEAQGIGRSTEGAIADLRGERVRVFPEAALRVQVEQHYPSAIEWSTIGLPEDYLPLFAPGRSAFVDRGDTIVTHGGISLEELIVPFVQIDTADE